MSLLSHDRYQYDSLILSKQTWAYPRQHLQQLLWCVVSVRLNLPEVEERKTLSSTLLRKLCVHYANGFDNYITLKVSISFIVTLYYAELRHYECRFLLTVSNTSQHGWLLSAFYHRTEPLITSEMSDTLEAIVVEVTALCLVYLCQYNFLRWHTTMVFQVLLLFSIKDML